MLVVQNCVQVLPLISCTINCYGKDISMIQQFKMLYPVIYLFTLTLLLTGAPKMKTVLYEQT